MPISDFQSQFSMPKIIEIFLNFCFIEEYKFRSTFFCYWHILITLIFKSLYFLKGCSIFDSSPILQFSKFNDFLCVCRFLATNLSNSVSLPWNLHNQYCHNLDVQIAFRSENSNDLFDIGGIINYVICCGSRQPSRRNLLVVYSDV